VSASLKHELNSVIRSRKPGVAVRLDHGDHLAVRRHGAGGLQHGGDLDRVVAIVVDHADAVGDARGGEAALDPAEAGQAGADGVGVDASSRATATAAVALSTLWWPAIGIFRPS
jgi:hypothetical protein